MVNYIRMAIVPLLESAIRQKASDLHLMAGHAPVFRVNGKLVASRDRVLTSSQTEALARELLGRRLAEFQQAQEADFGYEMGERRFRVNVHVERGCVAIAVRVVRKDLPTYEEIGLPESGQKLAESHNGLVLVTGPSGTGKSTTLAAMIGHVNATRAAHILTLEDPIEFVFPIDKGLVKQREVGSDTHSFAEGLRHALRQDPDIIMVGEMRDPETISSALTLAETGHLVLSTLHTNSAAETVHRIVDSFAEHQQAQVRAQLALSLRGIIAQTLLPNTDGGRVAAHEIMINTPAIANLIRENKVEQIQTVLQTSRKDGMQTMEQSLDDLVKQKVITAETASPYYPARLRK